MPRRAEGLEGKIAIVEDDAFLRDQLVWALKGRFEVVTAEDGKAGLALADTEFDVFLVDLRLPPSNEVEEGLALVEAVRKKRPDAAVIVMSAEQERKHAIRAVELGAFDFFRKPFDKAELQLVLGRALERQRLLAENRALKEQAFAAAAFDDLVGKTPTMKQLFRQIEKVAPTDATVLVYGESGTGKELVARSLHRGSLRRAGPFIAVNGSALPESLAESELFGHEKGAFTGAIASRPGKFELAHRGTLFLDEVATLSAAVQAKLLRALETRQIERVGGTRPITVDTRFVAATNEDLQKQAAKGLFREDLFYRLNTVILRIPPLRERRDDIPLLAELFAERSARKYGRTVKRFSPEALAVLRAHAFRGNVRELEHLVEMLTLMADEDVITPEHLPAALARGATGRPEPAGGETRPFAEAVSDYERELLTRAIAAANGVKARAARALGLDANQMKYLCRKFGL